VATHAKAAMATTMPAATATAATWGHEHPATRQGGYQRGDERCANYVFQLHQKTPKGKICCLPDAR